MAPTARSASASGSTTLGFGWATGYIYFTLPKARRVTFRGRLQPWVSGKDIVLELLRRWGAEQSQGMSVELVDADRQLPIAYRNTIANMMAEAEALNGIFAPDEITVRVVRGKGDHRAAVSAVTPGGDARTTRSTRRSTYRTCVPMIAKPFSPGNAFPATDVARERITFDKAMIGSCTNGSYDDLLQAALVLRAARDRWRANGRTRASDLSGVRRCGPADRSSPTRGSAANRSRPYSDPSGGEIRQSWCGPCFGQGPDALTRGQRAITSFNRNWQNRMGLGGEGYLASPAVVAASALVGYMAPPERARPRLGPGGVRRLKRAASCRLPPARHLVWIDAERHLADHFVRERGVRRMEAAGAGVAEQALQLALLEHPEPARDLERACRRSSRRPRPRGTWPTRS